MAILHVLVTPIGNLEDCSLRLLRVLSEVKHLACEDTRVTHRIFERHNLPRPKSMFSYHEHNEDSAGRRILRLLDAGEDVGLVSDAGTPGISDPGFRVVRAAVEAGHEVDVIPGPSAPVTALILSGLPTSSFTFKGFPPRGPGKLRRFFEMDQVSPHTLIFFESKFRLHKSLRAALEVLGDREAAVCIEITKAFQTVRRDYLSALVEHFENEPTKGEITVVVAGNHSKFQRSTEEE